jgi:hypothetical protein
MYVFEIDPQDMKVYVVSRSKSIAQAGGPSQVSLSVTNQWLTSSANEPTFSVKPSETIAATCIQRNKVDLFFIDTQNRWEYWQVEGNMCHWWCGTLFTTINQCEFLGNQVAHPGLGLGSYIVAVHVCSMYQLLHLQVKTSLTVLPVFVLIVPTRMGELTLTSKRHLQLFTGWCEKKGPPHTGHSRHRTIST